MRTLAGDILTFSVVALLMGACAGPEATPTPTGTPKTTLTPVSAPTIDAEDEYQIPRKYMIKLAEARGITDPRVLEAMRTVPRHLFVPERDRTHAYGDFPLPIGEGQTISQPFIVALMSQLPNVEPGERVLEIGTGSGYQAAVLAEMGAKVYSIEVIPTLASVARECLDSLGYGEIQTQVGDGYYGWVDQSPFDGIIVTAAPDHVPPYLLNQLKPTGRMVIPVGPPGSVQTLWLIKQEEGEWVFLNQGPVSFVTFVRNTY